MTKLLFIKASPRKESATSGSIAIGQAYVDAALAKDPGLEVDTIDLWQEPLPPFDGDKAGAKMALMTGQEQSATQKTAWDEILDIIARFKSADIYVFSVAMWNGGIPYRLKHYIDIIHQPGLMFGLDPATGYFGLLENKRAVLAYTSGAWGPEMPSPAYGVDHQSTYMRAWLNQAGVTDISEIRFQPSLLNPDPDAAFKAAIAQATQLAG